jgi:hypothetical protein
MRNFLRKIVVLALLAGVCGWLYAKRTKAAPQRGFGQAACVTYIPRE